MLVHERRRLGVARVLIIGGGVVGMGLGMMLAHDDHAVTILERDSQPAPVDPDGAWKSWERRGVNQFRLPHLFLSRYRQILEQELPAAAAAIDRAGAVRFNPVRDAPDFITGGAQEGDHRFEILSGRRAVVERAVASVAEETVGLEVRRGVAVTGLSGDIPASGGVPRVTGVRTADGEELRADLVVDCGGRRSALSDWLEALGARRPVDDVEDSGFIYFGRHFHSRDGQLPAAIGPALQPYGSISVLTLPADNGTWAVTVVARSGDRALLGLKDLHHWEQTVRALPTAAHWLDGEPIEDHVVTMAKIEDRHRDLYPGGVPVATGVVAVADAWSCTNPSLGRGASIGMLHARALRDTLRQVASDEPIAFSDAFAAATAEIVEPWYQSTLSFDRHRLGEMAALADGSTYDPGDPAYEMAAALSTASSRDPDAFRGVIDVALVLELPEVVLARPGMFDKVVELGSDWRSEPAFGPDRAELVKLANG
jgi:2-polyprenyl-6-methoxyphenol hydroxylase-like FAD-dependent oxidoreductase